MEAESDSARPVANTLLSLPSVKALAHDTCTVLLLFALIWRTIWRTPLEPLHPLAKVSDPKWVSDLRGVLKREHGKGWEIRDHRGRVQLTRRYEDRTRSSTYLPFEWSCDNSTKILNAVKDIHVLMDERNLSLKDAAKLSTIDPSAASKPMTQKVTGWEAIAADFLKSRGDRRSSTKSDLSLRVNRALETFRAKPKPQDGFAVMKRYAELFFYGPNGEESGPNVRIAPGGSGRKRNLNDVAAFLVFAVERCGAPTRFMPPAKDRIQELIGIPPTSLQQRLKQPLKPDQLTGLLDALLEDGRQDLWLAVALVGYFGLRPSELAVLTVENGKGYVGSIKRNPTSISQPPKPPRRVMPLEIEGRNGEGARALELFASGLVRLPKALRNQITLVEKKGKFQDVGAEFGQQLDRCSHWQSLVAATPGLSAYSMRHGFAWRASFGDHKLPTRVVAGLMGHSLGVHQAHYGAWTDEVSIEEAADAFNQALKVAK